MRQRIYLLTLLLLGLLGFAQAQSNPYGVDPTATPVPCTSIELDFEDGQIPSDWRNVSLLGDRKWQIKYFDENTAIRMTAFNSDRQCTTAFVSPLLEFPANDGQGYHLSFWSHTGYSNGAKLVTKLLDRSGNVVQVLEEYIKESHQSWAPFWDEHILYIPDGTEPVHISFEYVGNDDPSKGAIMTTTYELDDISIDVANAEQELTASITGSYDFYARPINQEHTFTISYLGRNLPGDIQLSLKEEGSSAFSLSTTTLPKEGGDVVVTYHPTASGSHFATLSAEGGDIYTGIMLYGRGFDPANPYSVDPTMLPQALDEDFEPYGWDDPGYQLPKGWNQIALKGRIDWVVKSYNGNMFIQINPFGLGQEVETAVTTPLIDMDPTKDHTLSFDYNWAFGNGAELNIVLLDKSGKVVEALTTLTHTDDVLWKDSFSKMEILLPKGTDDSFIAFVYKGIDTTDKNKRRTTAYQLDNVKVTTEGGSAATGSIKASEQRVDFGEFLVGEEDAYVISLTGEGLTEAMSISLEGDPGFSISPSTLPKEGGDLYIVFSATKAGSYTTTIQVKSGEVSLSIPVLATVAGHEHEEPTKPAYKFDTTATPVAIDEDFEADALPEGWSSQALAGTRQWLIKEWSNNRYAQFSAHNSGEQEKVGLISPLVAMDAAREYQLQFDLKTGFCNGATLRVYLYDATGTLVKELTTITATEPASGFADGFTTQTIALPKGAGNSFILFEYDGDDSGANKRTTTYQVDNVKVTAKETTTPTASIKSSVARIELGTVAIDKRASQQITLTGEALTEAMTLSLEGDAGFALSATTLPKEGGDVTVTFSATKAGSFTTQIVVKSGYATLRIPVRATVTSGNEPTKPTYKFDTTATPVAIDEDFEADLLPEGWSSQALVGTRQWIIKMYSDNRYAQFSAHNSGEQLTVGLISPLVAMDAAREYQLQFDLKTGFCNGATLRVYLYDATGTLVKELTTITATEPASGFADGFTAQTIALPKGTGNSFILFEYDGDDSGADKRTTTYQVDNVKVTLQNGNEEITTQPAYTLQGHELTLTDACRLTIYTLDGSIVAEGHYPAMSRLSLEPHTCYLLQIDGITYKVMTL